MYILCLLLQILGSFLFQGVYWKTVCWINCSQYFWFQLPSCTSHSFHPALLLSLIWWYTSVLLIRREAELVNKYHYAFHYFKKPIEIKMFHSPNLKKAYDVKKESKPDTPTKPRKIKVRCALRFICYTLYFNLIWLLASLQIVADCQIMVYLNCYQTNTCELLAANLSTEVEKELLRDVILNISITLNNWTSPKPWIITMPFQCVSH